MEILQPPASAGGSLSDTNRGFSPFSLEMPVYLNNKTGLN